ncbi:YybH family protein [Yeosuana sp.]|uniref:YybH family protein n=1 Tax=Yeosuana sp. TaxID=2529388 RepID=UPI004054CB17
MKTTTKFLALTVVVLLLSVTACKEETKTAPSKPATIEELGQMNRDFAKALVAKDATAAANLYTENASLLPPNEPMVTGRENIKNYWQGAIDAGLIAASVKTLDAKSDGILGYEIGTFELQFKMEDGTIITDIGKFTEILEKNAEGKWISTYGMWSANEVAK